MSNTGLRDWIIQRVTAIYLGIYIILMAICLLTHSSMDFRNWINFLGSPTLQIATLIALLALCWHAWVGVWTIITDYINCPVLRMTVQALVLFVLIAYFFWGVVILFWGLGTSIGFVG